MASPFSRTVARWIAVAGGCGYVPRVPGTAGSVAGALLFLLTFGFTTGAPWASQWVFQVRSWLSGSEHANSDLGSLTPVGFQLLLCVLIAMLSLVGIWASGSAERDFGRKDDGRIVIDEVVGQLVALAPLPFLLGSEGRFMDLFVGVVTGFVLFRLFDVWKPGAIGWAERSFKGGVGVMADDLVAGVHAAGVLIALAMMATAVSTIAGTAAAEIATGQGFMALGAGLS